MYLRLSEFYPGHAVTPFVGGTALQSGRSRIRFSMGRLRFFIGLNPFCLTAAQESTQRLTEMSTRDLSCGVKTADAKFISIV